MDSALLNLISWFKLTFKSPKRCFYCGIKLKGFQPHFQKKPPNDMETEDHVVPISLGGDRGHSNRVPCCRVCNLKKGDGGIDEFRVLLRWGLPFYSEIEYLNRCAKLPTWNNSQITIASTA